jgi:hypothetical protein
VAISYRLGVWCGCSAGVLAIELFKEQITSRLIVSIAWKRSAEQSAWPLMAGKKAARKISYRGNIATLMCGWRKKQLLHGAI